MSRRDYRQLVARTSRSAAEAINDVDVYGPLDVGTRLFTRSALVSRCPAQSSDCWADYQSKRVSPSFSGIGMAHLDCLSEGCISRNTTSLSEALRS
jgi:hypothetical protein